MILQNQLSAWQVHSVNPEATVTLSRADRNSMVAQPNGRPFSKSGEDAHRQHLKKPLTQNEMVQFSDDKGNVHQYFTDNNNHNNNVGGGGGGQ